MRNRNKNGTFQSQSSRDFLFVAWTLFGVAVYVMCAGAGVFDNIKF